MSEEPESYPEERRKSDGRWMMRLDHAVALLYWAEKVIVYRETPSALSIKVQVMLKGIKTWLRIVAFALQRALRVFGWVEKKTMDVATAAHLKAEADAYRDIRARIVATRNAIYLLGLSYTLPDWRDRPTRRKHVWRPSRG